ncbi:hypothetical protein [Nitratireductor sp. XY-223]|uniref:hypothetical protein n=1 Tax=Nitratireductor sp. XY-223 TaxID=2561926 RepID=UPI002484A333|nr:hypothetical protein [Nitratireductor sp. XY-223]
MRSHATEADKAEATLTGLALLQTGDPMAKKHADAARAAAAAAMAAYNTAKAESAKAAAATTSTAAVVARMAAQAAQKTAQAQAKIATDKAAAAVKAAGMEVKVTYDDDGQATYKVGEFTIVPGAKKNTVTTNGKTVVTGKVDDLKLNLINTKSHSNREAVQSVEKTETAPETRGMPGINPPLGERKHGTRRNDLGGNAADILRVTEGADRLSGEDGNDRLWGGDDNDTLYGG